MMQKKKENPNHRKTWVPVSCRMGTHRATWLSYPHADSYSWPDIAAIFPFYHQFIREISKGKGFVSISAIKSFLKFPNELTRSARY